MRGLIIVLCAGSLLAGCSSLRSVNNALGTPKNPTRVFSDPRSKERDDESVFIRADFATLLEAVDMSGTTIRMKTTEGVDMRRYLAAGYNLADAYCARYFDKTDEAYRRRRFGRTLTNDVGTAATTFLGIAGATQGVVTALATATGLADSAWRNYDDSFVISPELATVKSLVQAAKDNYRAKTLGPKAEMPGDFGTAHSTIRRYSEFCSHLGMRSLLEQSAGKEERDLIADTDKRTARPVTSDPTPSPTTDPKAVASSPPTTAQPVVEAPPVTSVPVFPANKDQETPKETTP